MSMEVAPSSEYLTSHKHSWWSMQSTRERKLCLALAGVTVLALIFLSCTIGLGSRKRYEPNCAYLKENSTCSCKDEYCTTRVCIQTASDMKNRMNEDLNPCDNFYSFACERFESTQKEIGGVMKQTGNDMNNDLLDLLKTADPEAQQNSVLKSAIYLYKKCTSEEDSDDEKAVKVVRDIVEEVLGTSWPIAVGSNWNESDFDWTKSLARLWKLDDSAIFKYEIFPDREKAENLSLWLQISERNFTTPANLTDFVCTLYPKCTLNATLDPSLNQGTYSASGINILKAKEQVPVLPGSLADSLKNFTKYTLKELESEIPQVNWKAFFQTLFNGTGYKMTDTFTVIWNAAVFRTVDDLVKKDKRGMANMIGGILAMKLGSYTSSRIRKFFFPTSQLDQLCLDVVRDVHGFALGKLYVENLFTPDSLKEVKELASEIQEGFKTILRSSSWLDKDTRNKALKKVENMAISVGSPNWVWNDDALSTYYKDAIVTKESPFQEAVLKAISNQFNQNVMELDKPFNKKNYWPRSESTTETNAFFHQITNTMYYPLGILRSPCYVPGRSRTINLGALGYVAGHELTHGFDFNGKDFDENGIVNDWWSVNTKEKFNSGARCFVKQYSNITDEQSGLQLNGTYTLPENIADNGGLKAAYQAYKDSPSDKSRKLVGFENYNEDQMFFISAAQIWCAKASKESMIYDINKNDHAPHKYRAIVPFQNFLEFSKTFNCKLGTKMNPKDKCFIW